MKVSFRNSFPLQTIQRGALSIRKTVTQPKSKKIFFQEQETDAREITIEAEQAQVHVCLNDLLPSNWKILEAQRVLEKPNATCDFEGRYVILPAGLWQNNGLPAPYLCWRSSMYGLLHEIGHSYDTDPNVIEHMQLIKGCMAVFGDDAIGGEHGIPEEDYMRYIIEPERQAAIFAIEQILRYREEDIDLEPGMNKAMLIASAEKSLQTYCIRDDQVLTLGMQ